MLIGASLKTDCQLVAWHERYSSFTHTFPPARGIGEHDSVSSVLVRTGREMKVKPAQMKPGESNRDPPMAF